MSTGKGVVQLASAGVAVYGMATGTVPVNEATIMFTGAMATSGIHAIGSDTSKVEAVTQKAINVVNVVDQVAVMKKEAEDGKKKVEAYAEVSKIVNNIVNPQP